MGTGYEHLNCEERTMIQLSLERDYTLRTIARSMQRAPSTIRRKLKRNGCWSNPATAPRRRGRSLTAGSYRAPAAQQRADTLARMPRTAPRLAPTGPLCGHVQRLLRQRHSPEQIAGILRRMYPDQPNLQVSHETIYTALYAMPWGQLRSQLIACPRQAHMMRRPHARGQDRRGTIPNMISTHLRPPEIDERVIPGHWEADLIKGARNASAIGTLVERTSLFVTLARMENASANSAVVNFSAVLNQVGAQWRLSFMTYDQGRELARRQRLSKITGGAVYFADPHSPWQRDINENTNCLLRQYFPDGIDLSSFTQAELDAVAWQLNTRPRKSLGWRCPAELFIPESFDFFKHYHQLVALQT